MVCYTSHHGSGTETQVVRSGVFPLWHDYVNNRVNSHRLKDGQNQSIFEHSCGSVGLAAYKKAEDSVVGLMLSLASRLVEGSDDPLDVHIPKSR